MNLDEAIASGIKSGQELDKIFICLETNVIDLSIADPFLSIQLNSIDVFELFFSESDYNFWYIDQSFFNFVAYYNHSKDFPLGRAYFIKFSSMVSATNLWKKLYRGIKLSSEEDVNKLVGYDTYKKRIQIFKETPIQVISATPMLFSLLVKSYHRKLQMVS